MLTVRVCGSTQVGLGHGWAELLHAMRYAVWSLIKCTTDRDTLSYLNTCIREAYLHPAEDEVVLWMIISCFTIFTSAHKTNISFFSVEQGKKSESLEFGLSVMHIMMTKLIDLNTRQMMILWMLKLLLSDLRIHDMVSIMREFFYMTDYYDLSCKFI